MKVISIIQPWATLIAIGEKRYETRSWNTKHRGELAIHASKKVDTRICKIEPFRSVLAKHGLTADNLPIGAIIAKCQLMESLQVVINHGDSAVLGIGRHFIGGNELAFGDYSEGRFAWDLIDVTPIDPIPAKGQLGLWNYHPLNV
jgi:hypothetical protein